MMIASYIILGFGMLALTFFLIEKVRKYSVKATIIKAVTSLLFVSLGVVSWYGGGQSIFGLFVIIALVMGLMGDIWLDLKYVFREHDEIFTYAGFISFALGHVMYITGMFLQYYVPGNVLYIIIPLICGILAGALTVVLEKPLKLQYGNKKLICFIYGSLLFSMVACALSLTILHKFNSVTLIMMFGGGLLFAISDLILCMTYFGDGHERPIDIITNGVTYYLAQYAIAYSLMFMATVI